MYFWIFWAKNWSRGSGSALKSFLDALGSILTKYQPKRSHGDQFQLNFDCFWTFFDDHFFDNQLFLKKSISRGPSGQSAKLKMIAYWSSNSEVLTDFWRCWCIFTSIPCHFCQKPVFHFKPYNISSEGICIFLSPFTNNYVLRGGAPAGAFLFPKNDT